MNQIYPYLFREIKYVHKSFNNIKKMTASRNIKKWLLTLKREELIPARKDFRNVLKKSLGG